VSLSRYRLTLEYDGTPFRGWQRQAEGPSVQAALEEAVRAASGEAVEVTAAGRTDAGVHALAQVAHLDLARDWAPERLMAALNAHLRPLPVAVLEARAVAAGFHARFDAVRRRYVYRILNRRAPPALDLHRCWHVPVPLEAESMHEAAQALVGRHDFTSFRSSECQAPSAVKTLDLAHVRRRGGLIEIRLAARSFLHHQVRNIAGTLRLVGEGKAGPDHLRRVLDARDRAAAGQTAPAAGLFLEGVDYATPRGASSS
jgi:tRNA pseudouridine38-40 synthase